MSKNNLTLMTGGSNGGVRISSPCTTGAYDIIVVEKDVILTVLEDELATDVLAAKNLSGFTFTAVTILSAGIGHTVKKLTFSGGSIFGYTM
jgi:hypothetical protein